MEKKMTEFLAEIEDYYSNKLELHGPTPQGVDWNSEGSQNLRFDQLNKIFKTKSCFSVNDLGCGYGALFDYLNTRHESFAYTGIDISEDMINVAKSHYRIDTRFIISNEPDKIADYSVASGIFNVRLGRSDSEWQSYIENTLSLLNKFSHYGFAFNCLTVYSDRDKMQEQLYYADPCALFDICKKLYSPNVSLLHDYGLYEFTILVRKIL